MLSSIKKGGQLNKICVSGMGIVCALGDTLDAFTDALKSGRSGIRALTSTEDLPLQEAALITNFPIEDRLQALALPDTLIARACKAVHRAPQVLQTAVYSALSAWQQAGLEDIEFDNQRTGLIIAGQNLTSGYCYEQSQRYGADLEYLPASFGLHCLDTNLLGTLSEILQIQGCGFTVGGASASGNVGLIQAKQMIESGVVERCIVVGAMADLSPLELHAWNNMGAIGGKRLPPGESCRPFDKDHEGFIYGQGAGCIILECADTLQKRQATPLASVIGTALTLDGNRSANPSVTGEARTMALALENASITAADIDYINTHGTSSALGDDTEIAAINTVFADHVNRIWLNATKGLTGHCLYAAGVIEAIATILQMQHGFVHPNKHLNNPIDSHAHFASAVAETATISHALSNAFGFGGINSALVFAHD